MNICFRDDVFFKKWAGGLLFEINNDNVIGYNDTLQEASRLLAYIIVEEVKILKTNLKSEEIIKF